MAQTLRIALAQLNLKVGDVAGNTGRIIESILQARDEEAADLILFQELAPCGYPTEDLLFNAGLRQQVQYAMNEIREASGGISVLIGYPEYADGVIYNAAALFSDGIQRANYRKHCLPNYAVFDENRYFIPGTEAVVADISGVPIGITICEDVWEVEPCARAVAAGAKLIVAINGSPFRLRKQAEREAELAKRCNETGVPIVYQNLVGGQDELVFDGGSCVLDAGGHVVMRAEGFSEGLYCCDFDVADHVEPRPGAVAPLPDDEASIYSALVTGVRDYVGKNGFPGVVLGLSGGLDSALTLAIAVDALGAAAVEAIMMPYRYTSAMSLEDAEDQAGRMGVEYRVIPIEPMVAATNSTLEDLFQDLPVDATEENIQSRCRGLLLMAISNKTGRMVLATGNKSEMAVGYATLYGDMAGGFAPIKDCFKTLVVRLAHYRNSISKVIPQRVIDRPPSAELAPDQKDTDSLPPYEVLDAILEGLMIENRSADEIAFSGYDIEVVDHILAMVRRNEYKRRQAPPGVRISGRAFGRDWRYPITSGYQHKKILQRKPE
jgi:NAD+ synthase (glutamine-hydrolysing)